MPMKHRIHHHLDLQASKEVAEKALASYKTRFARYEPQVSWLGSHRAEVRFSAKGFKIAGYVELLPGAVEIEIDVPLVFRPLRATAIRLLEGEIQRLLNERAAQKTAS